MSSWQYQDVYGEWNTPSITYDSSSNSNLISFGAESVSQGDIFAIYDLSSERLKSGDSYHFTLSLITKNWGSNSNFFGMNGLIIGFATIDNDGFIQFQEDCALDISSENFSSFSVSNTLLTVDYDFVCPSYVGTPCFCILIYRTSDWANHNNLTYSFSDLSLTRNISPELDGVLGWLEELVTWVKELPGLVASKFSSFFASVEQNLDLNFDTLWETLEERLNVFDNFFTEIRNFFHDLYWDLVGGTCGYGDYHSSLFERLGDRISGFFDDLKLKIDVKVEEIKTSIHDFFVPPEGFFEEWKDKFDLMLSDNLGFIYQAPNFVKGIIEVVQEILQTDQEVNLVFPAVEFDIAGYHIELFKDTKVDFSFLEAGIWLTLYTMYKVMLYVIFALALIKYGIDTWERTMSN